MNLLYEEVDAIVSKPGGVTISEALKKRLPVFVNSALPGQEKINLEYLKDRGLVFELEENNPLEEQLIGTLNDWRKMLNFHQSVRFYQNGIEIEKTSEIVEIIRGILYLRTTIPSYVEKKKNDVFAMEGSAVMNNY